MRVRSQLEPWERKIDSAAQRIADNAIHEINKTAPKLDVSRSDMPYKAQALLERVIELLEDAV